MDVRIVSVVIVSVVVLLLAQTVSSIDATHVPKYKNAEEARKEFQEKSKEIEKEKTAKNEEIRKAYIAYKITHKDWKTAKVEWKTAKISGDQTTIDAKKVILDQAIIDRDLAMKKYYDVKKSR